MKKYHGGVPYFLSFLFIAFSLWLGIVSCRVPLEGYNAPTAAPRNAWLTKWLEKPVCQPPCFLGITPGTTTMTETIQLFSRMPDIQITSGPLFIDESEHMELSWDFDTPTPDDGGRLMTDINGRTISFIDLSTGRDQNLVLAEIIESFGQPDHVYLSDCRGRTQCVVHVIYVTSGMVIETLLPAEENNDYTRSVEISADVRTEEIWFFPPGEDGYRGAFGFWANYLSESQLPWNGYTTYTEK